MDAGSLLLQLAVALLAARAAAELAERFRQPAVLAEIAAGLVLGPSVLGIVHGDDVIRSLGELGAVLLLFEVGLHMDLRELRRVGRSAMQVATIGVVTPMLLAYPLLRAFGVSSRISIFLAAGITATSVGITARVFSDLRALASVEARTVLGAAVADDVMGLVILAIVVGAESASGVAASSIAGTIALALGFLAAATAIGVLFVPAAIDWIAKRSRTDGTSLILALVVALALAGAASHVKLAPVVGAFVAGLAVGPSRRRDDVQRRLQPIGQLLIPLFFLQIGIDTSVGAFGHLRVLEIAAALTAVAVVGKIVAGLGAKRGTTDQLLVGIAMIPRGEVGLIFASIGLTQHILDPRSHSILVVVVMASTVVSPALIRWRIKRVKRAASRAAAAEEPSTGWLVLGKDDVELAADPPAELAIPLGLDAAVACASRRPGPRLLAWLSEEPPPAETEIGDDVRARVFRLLHEGSVRSWRFLEVTGLLGRLFPEIEEAIAHRARDPFDLDPIGALRWDTLEGLHALEAAPRDPASALWLRFPQPELVRLAALARDAFEEEEAEAKTKQLAARLGLDELAASLVLTMVVERHLLPAASRRLDMGSEESVLELAAHLSDVSLADALYVLAVAEDAMEPTDRERLDELHALVRQVLSHPEVAGVAGDLLSKKRGDALEVLKGSFPERALREYLDAAPARYLLTQSPDAIARHIRLVETKPTRFETRLYAEPLEARGDWMIHVAFVDRQGALAALAGAFATCSVSVEEAFVSTWRNEVAIDVFKVTARDDIDWQEVQDAVTARLNHPVQNGAAQVVEGSVTIDNQASPWHTIVEVRARDRTGLLYRVASALARAGADIHSAQVATYEGVAIDSFAVTGPNGGKLDEAGVRALHLAFEGKTPSRWRSPFRSLTKAGRR